MGITYFFLGLSSLIKNEILIGTIQLSLAIIALIFLLISVLPSNSFKIFYSLDDKKISLRNSLITKEKGYFWEEIDKIEITESFIILIIKSKEVKIRLSALNYNESKLFIDNLNKYIEKYNINSSHI